MAAIIKAVTPKTMAVPMRPLLMKLNAPMNKPRAPTANITARIVMVSGH